METKGYRHIPQSLFDAITFLTQALPKRAVPTFLELLFGAMITSAGFVTQAWLAIRPRRHWTSYYKWLQKGHWSWVSLGLQTARLALHQVWTRRCFLIIDDTLVFRNSRKAPESRIHRQHGSKANRPDYVRGQNWVSLALSVSQGFRSVAVPVLSRLSRTTGNSGKLVAAKTLLRVARPLFEGRLVTVLLDSWYMRKTLLFRAQEMGYHVIGQVRKDTALYFPPPRHNGKRGRPRKYGQRWTPEVVGRQPVIRQQLFLYGGWKTVHYRSAEVLTYFLDGQRVRAVWVQLENEEGTLRSPRLILCTDVTLSAARILMAYHRRWAIEDLFNQLKNRWGWKEAWQQTRQVLHRWTQILSTSYAIPQLLALQKNPKVEILANNAPWRRQQPLTAGRVRQGLARIFSQIDIRGHWNAKQGKFGPINGPLYSQPPPDDRMVA